MIGMVTPIITAIVAIFALVISFASFWNKTKKGRG